MVREISAGGVVVRNQEGAWWMAAIELPADSSARATARSKRPVRSNSKVLLCLPKGLVDPGEKAVDAAVREVREETGITAAMVAKLADIKYMYVRTWSDGQRVFKIVSFYLLRYESGEINNISDDMRVEVACAKWVRLGDAPKLLAYRGEKQMARKAIEYVEAHADL